MLTRLAALAALLLAFAAAPAAAKEDPARWSEGFLAAKRSSASFYIEQLLPAACGLVAAVKADPARLFEIEEAHL